MIEQHVRIQPQGLQIQWRDYSRWVTFAWMMASVFIQTTLSLPLKWGSIADSNTDAANATILGNAFGEIVARYFDLTVGKTYMGFNPFVPSIYVPTYFFFSSKLTGPVFQGMVQDFGITFMTSAGLSEAKLFMVMPGQSSPTKYRRITMQYDIASDMYTSTSMTETG